MKMYFLFLLFRGKETNCTAIDSEAKAGKAKCKMLVTEKKKSPRATWTDIPLQVQATNKSSSQIQTRHPCRKHPVEHTTELQAW